MEAYGPTSTYSEIWRLVDLLVSSRHTSTSSEIWCLVDLLVPLLRALTSALCLRCMHVSAHDVLLKLTRALLE